jgi:hypothetical protein
MWTISPCLIDIGIKWNVKVGLECFLSHLILLAKYSLRISIQIAIDTPPITPVKSGSSKSISGNPGLGFMRSDIPGGSLWSVNKLTKTKGYC